MTYTITPWGYFQASDEFLPQAEPQPVVLEQELLAQDFVRVLDPQELAKRTWAATLIACKGQ